MKKILLAILLFIFFVALTSCDVEIINIGNYIPYEHIPDDYTLENAKDDGLVVYESGSSITSGQDVWDEFVSHTENGTPCMVRLAFYYTLDNQNISPEHYEEIKDDYPALYIQDFTYDGRTYTLYYTEDSGEYSFKYKYLRRFEDNTPPASAVFHNAVYYYLINDLDVTYEEIRHGMFSSRFGDMVDCQRVYTWLNYKDA